MTTHKVRSTLIWLYQRCERRWALRTVLCSTSKISGFWPLLYLPNYAKQVYFWPNETIPPRNWVFVDGLKIAPYYCRRMCYLYIIGLVGLVISLFQWPAAPAAAAAASWQHEFNCGNIHGRNGVQWLAIKLECFTFTLVSLPVSQLTRDSFCPAATTCPGI